ncbi:Apc13p-domain-containing protein [Sporormia fimetaria CBS 119925]|uniref:Apc13p-domain-containing protein n=1 Tax=Sporormia fimetaria CBS 119925 TaxID=1340428 RepID=A0A6A6UUT3_9PLEO|nr:Apc13p-domain-containing protein [Sporormia fimetaria CBS 119925]
MSRDSSSTYLHMHHSHHADLLESFTHPQNSQLHAEDIYVPPHLQPINPEDEDDVVPDQHAAFGIQRATQQKREPVWRDLGLEELVRRGPGEGAGVSGAGAAAAAGAAGGTAGQARREEPVVLALRRRTGGGTVPGAALGGAPDARRRAEAWRGAAAGNANALPR